MASSISRPVPATRLNRAAPLLNVRRLGLTLGVAALSGVLSALVLPRGPTTQFQALALLVGESWGSLLGVLAVQQAPELFHAFIGSGQMVSVRETDRRIYQDVLALAARTNDPALAARMRSYGQPPYADLPYANVFALGQYDALYKPYMPSAAYRELGASSGIGPYGVFGSEYNLIEKFNVLRGLMDTFTVMHPQLQQMDFRKDVRTLDVPVYILDGTSELSARRDLTLEWLAALQAPIKTLVLFENAAHSVAFEQFQKFGTLMRETVLPQTDVGP